VINYVIAWTVQARALAPCGVFLLLRDGDGGGGGVPGVAELPPAAAPSDEKLPPLRQPTT
jgi:hypothetical protein